MNTRAAAYLATYSVTRMIAGIPEVVLPLDKLQGFLDLVEPGDVPSYQHVQRLYHAQASPVHTIQQQLAHHDTQSTSAPLPQPETGHRPRPAHE